MGAPAHFLSYFSTIIFLRSVCKNCSREDFGRCTLRYLNCRGRTCAANRGPQCSSFRVQNDWPYPPCRKSHGEGIAAPGCSLILKENGQRRNGRWPTALNLSSRVLPALVVLFFWRVLIPWRWIWSGWTLPGCNRPGWALHGWAGAVGILPWRVLPRLRSRVCHARPVLRTHVAGTARS